MTEIIEVCPKPSEVLARIAKTNVLGLRGGQGNKGLSLARPSDGTAIADKDEAGGGSRGIAIT